VSPMPKLPLASAEAPPTPALPLRIAETFRSIQGEGKLAGVPSFFIRVSGCNLRCVWCDTPYASWKPEGGVRGVEALAQEAAAAGTRHIVLTGGEPMLFPQIVPLSRALREHGLHVTIETAGTVAQPVACDLMSISPKLANSTPGTGPAPDPRDPGGAWRERHEQRRLNFVVLQSLIDAHPERQLKFVVSTPQDLGEIEAVLARLSGWTPAEVLLMPEGVTPPSSQLKSWIVQVCLDRGFRYCPRLHIDLFGNTRGT
jgi:7-carboxy-7-deazaguanine synthase